MTLVCFLFIPVVLLSAFVLYPALKLLYISMTDWDGVKSTINFIGLKNYKDMLFNSPDVWLSLKNNGIYFYIHTLAVPFEIILAVVMHKKLKGSGFFKAVTFMPYIINGVAVAYIFSFFFSSSGGALNMILEFLHLDSLIQGWLSNADIVNYTLASISLWKYCGFHIIFFLAALQSVPSDIVEASVIDGANGLQQLIFVYIPSILTVVELVLFLNIQGALQVFDIPFLVTGGGPGYASSTFTLYSLDSAFKYNNFGMASSMGITLLILIVIFNWVQKKILFKGE